MKEESLRKSSHKLLLVTLKFIPMVTALCYMFNVLFSYLGIDLPVLSQVGGMSMLTWLFIWIATYVFKFCIYHRMFLYYILISDLLNITDYYVGIPLSTTRLLMLHLVIICVFMFLILYTYVKCNKKAAGETTQ